MRLDLPPLSSLRAFEAAARLESFTRAAEEIGLTPGAVSHQIKSLEAYLGAALFIRHGRRRVSLTREGAGFAEQVSAALSGLAAAAEAMRRGTQERLTISVLPSFAARWLMPRIGSFVDQCPGLDLTVRSTTAHADFVRDGVDLAIRFGPGVWPRAQAELLMHDQLFSVCSPALLGDGPAPASPQELADLTWLESDPEGWERWFAAAGAALPPGKRRIDVGDASLALQAAIDGGGVAMTRRSLAERELAAGRLARLCPQITARSQFSYYLVWPTGAALDRPAQAFRDWLRAQIEDLPPELTV